MKNTSNNDAEQAINFYQDALLHYQKSQITLSEIYIRKCLELEPKNNYALDLLSKIKIKYGISNNFILTEKKSSSSDNRFLLIKAWGFGFWSDVHHIITQLLLAELTQRKPIIFWGKNSLFRNNELNAFPYYFNSDQFGKLDELPTSSRIFPRKWTPLNIFEEDVNKWSGENSRLSAQFFFDRDEELLIADFYSPLDTMMHWIDPSSEYHGLSEDEIFRLLFNKYLTPSKLIESRTNEFYQSKMVANNWLAVHMRGSDKVLESPHLDLVNQQYYELIDKVINVNPGIGIFLMTDSESINKKFTAIYGTRILTPPAHRSNDSTGIHLSGHAGHLIGEEILIESYIATKCDYFIGNMESNVSLGISSLKDWKTGFIFLLGLKSSRGQNPFIYSRINN